MVSYSTRSLQTVTLLLALAASIGCSGEVTDSPNGNGGVGDDSSDSSLEETERGGEAGDGAGGEDGREETSFTQCTDAEFSINDGVVSAVFLETDSVPQYEPVDTSLVGTVTRYCDTNCVDDRDNVSGVLEVKSSSGDLWRIVSSSRDPVFGVSVGDDVVVRIQRNGNGWINDEALTIRLDDGSRGDDGTLAFWSFRSLTLDAFDPPPEFSLAVGERVCESVAGCGTEHVHRLDFTSGEHTRVLHPGTAALVEDWDVHLTSLTLAISNTGTCLDYFGGWAELTVRRSID